MAFARLNQSHEVDLDQSPPSPLQEHSPPTSYAHLKSPFDDPAGHEHYRDYSNTPSPAYPLRPLHQKHTSSYSVGEFGADKQSQFNDSSTHIVAGGNSPPYPPPNTIRESRRGNPWQPGFLEQFPWLGVGALIGTVLCTFAAVVVLVVSNRRPIDSWDSAFQPTVYISIATALANILLTYALYEGLVISFWRKAAEGTTLRELHQYWHSGSSLFGAVRGMFMWRGKVMAVACILTIVSILRGPLMQRASSVENINVHENGTTTVHAAQQLPLGWAGQDTGRTSSPSILLPNFTAVIQDYSKRVPMTIVHSPCGSSCLASIRAFGFGVSCNTSGIFYDLSPVVDANGTVQDLPVVEVFSTSASYDTAYGHGSASELDYYGNPPSSPDYTDYGSQQPNTALVLNATFMENVTGSYNGSLGMHACSLRAGIVEYRVAIANGTVTFQSPSWQDDKFIEDRGFGPLPYNSISNLAGFVLAANNLYQSSAQYEFGGGAGWILNFQGFMANQYLKRTSPTDNFYDLSQNISWRNPMDDMIDGIREIAFRSALQVASDNLTFTDSVQRVPYTGIDPRTVYTADYRAMAAAVVVSLLGVLGVIPTFRGWWLLGRRVTLSPLEVAKAFDAPLLGGAEGNVPAEKMLREIGGAVVRYGDVGAEGVRSNNGRGGMVMERKLRIADMRAVTAPEKGVHYA